MPATQYSPCPHKASHETTKSSARHTDRYLPWMKMSALEHFGIQAKFAVGNYDDALETEADRTAAYVLSAQSRADHRHQSPLAVTPTRTATGTAISGDAETLVSRSLSSAGQPLARPTRRYMERHFGHDFSNVRVHTGTAANDSADRLNARAFTHGEHIVFGSSQYVPHAHGGRRLIAHELTHVIQQRTGRANLVQRDVIDDVREKLSYGFLDWAITDAEANDALALLGEIPQPKLAAELTRLGTKHVGRLLDNLPDAAKSGAVYERVVSALGTQGTADYVEDQLSYGVFDWAVTSNEVARVFNVMANLPSAKHEKFLLDLARSRRLKRLLNNAAYGQFKMYILPWMNALTPGALNADQRKVMKDIARTAPSSPIEILKKAAEIRYDVSVGPSTMASVTGVATDAGKLRQTYLALDDLPDAHVARNQFVQRFGQFEKARSSSGTLTRGKFSARRTELASNTEASDITNTMIHETGHAVDEQLGWSTGPEPAKHTRGGWKTYASHRDCAIDMVQDANGAIKNLLLPPQRGNVINEMAAAMGARSTNNLMKNIRSQAWFSTLPARDRGKVIDDPALDALPTGLKEPWFNASNGGEQLGDHVYQESYKPTWVRYRHEARSRMIRKYQFRDAGEWFAVCYRAYYDPTNKTKGELLNKKDPDTKLYFDNVVDKLAASR